MRKQYAPAIPQRIPAEEDLLLFWLLSLGMPALPHSASSQEKASAASAERHADSRVESGLKSAGSGDESAY
jgi:hypothetical protein